MAYIHTHRKKLIWRCWYLLAVGIIKVHLGVDIQPSGIDRTHLIRKKNKAPKKDQAITRTILEKKFSRIKESLKEQIYPLKKV